MRNKFCAGSVRCGAVGACFVGPSRRVRADESGDQVRRNDAKKVSSSTGSVVRAKQVAALKWYRCSRGTKSFAVTVYDRMRRPDPGGGTGWW